MESTPYYSFKTGQLAKGCSMCVKGQKSVLFLTGLCSQKCFYCPISDDKKNKNVIYINEWKTSRTKDIKKEIRLCSSKGVGITGGDPLVSLNTTVRLIKELKKEFTKSFHIHLYAPLALANEKNLARLYNAGLDEIRFHPKLEPGKEIAWTRIKLAKKYPWKVGVEIPILPGYGKITKRLLAYLIRLNIDFINLNELEYSDTNEMHLGAKKLWTKDPLSYAVSGSLSKGKSLLAFIEKRSKIPVHLCTAKLKDAVQLKKRIMRRAKKVAGPLERISRDGTLIKGAIYLRPIVPGSKFNDVVSALGKNEKLSHLRELKDLKGLIKSDFDIESKLDYPNLRLLITEKNAIALAGNIKTKLVAIAIVEQMPTADSLTLEIKFLS